VILDVADAGILRNLIGITTELCGLELECGIELLRLEYARSLMHYASKALLSMQLALQLITNAIVITNAIAVAGTVPLS